MVHRGEVLVDTPSAPQIELPPVEPPPIRTPPTPPPPPNTPTVEFGRAADTPRSPRRFLGRAAKVGAGLTFVGLLPRGGGGGEGGYGVGGGGLGFAGFRPGTLPAIFKVNDGQYTHYVHTSSGTVYDKQRLDDYETRPALETVEIIDRAPVRIHQDLLKGIPLVDERIIVSHQGEFSAEPYTAPIAPLRQRGRRSSVGIGRMPKLTRSKRV